MIRFRATLFIDNYECDRFRANTEATVTKGLVRSWAGNAMHVICCLLEKLIN